MKMNKELELVLYQISDISRFCENLNVSYDNLMNNLLISYELNNTKKADKENMIR